MRKGDINDVKHRKMLIAILVNAIYLYDNKISLVINSSEGVITLENIPLDEIERNSEQAESYYINDFGVPKDL